MIGSNGDEEQRRQEVKQERERERENQRHLRQLEFDESGDLSREFVETMIDTEVLQESTVKILRNYLSRQWILSNMKDAEVWDVQHKLDVMELKVLGAHPPDQSSVQGPVRAFVYDDPDEELYALSQREREEIESFFDTVRYAVVTRSREGFEREQLISQVRESRTQREEQGNSSSSGRLGLF